MDGLFRLAGSEVSHGKTYNLSGAESISMVDFARLLLRHHGLSKPFLRIPVPLCRALAHLLRFFMEEPPLTTNAIAGVVNDADLDPAEAMHDLGYRPIGVREGFRRCFPLASPMRPRVLETPEKESPRIFGDRPDPGVNS